MTSVLFVYGAPLRSEHSYPATKYVAGGLYFWHKEQGSTPHIDQALTAETIDQFFIKKPQARESFGEGRNFFIHPEDIEKDPALKAAHEKSLLHEMLKEVE